MAAGKVLVVTYKSIEQEFAGIPNLSVAHFNAIAGLDAYREVHDLADVALPLVHDRVAQWEVVKPDIVQLMLLAGVAVRLHPDPFTSEKQAQKAFERDGFKRQNRIRDLHREMSLESGAYKRSGRGRSWQRIWWLSDDPETRRNRLVAALGDLVDWRPES